MEVFVLCVKLATVKTTKPQLEIGLIDWVSVCSPAKPPRAGHMQEAGPEDRVKDDVAYRHVKSGLFPVASSTI